jgi:hypothetical protein
MNSRQARRRIRGFSQELGRNCAKVAESLIEAG